MKIKILLFLKIESMYAYRYSIQIYHHAWSVVLFHGFRIAANILTDLLKKQKLHSLQSEALISNEYPPVIHCQDESMSKIIPAQREKHPFFMQYDYCLNTEQ